MRSRGARGPTPVPVEDSCVLVDGPWRHRDVTANGARFHVAEHGPTGGPLVLLLHGFPEFWWSWRHQLVALGEAGYHAVAPDLRGYGASDKPPRGYDQYTLSADVAGLVRALGAADATVVGHDWGGALGWAVATLHPRVVARLVTLAIPHPLRLAEALLRDGAQRRASTYLAYFQVPSAPEARLTRDDGAFVGELLRRWGGPGWPDPETEARCREAIQVPAVSNCALEWYRWPARSVLRPSGRQFRRLLARGVQAPVLHLHGSLDGCILPSTVDGSQAYARGGWTRHDYADLGHFLHQEDPERVTEDLLAWLGPAGA